MSYVKGELVNNTGKLTEDPSSGKKAHPVAFCSLIRKNHLAHTVAMYLSKCPESILKRAVPRTFFFNLSFPDEMDELLLDELYDVEESFRLAEEQGAAPRWWILKAALADKGNGIRLFSTRQQLEAILEEFEPLSDDEEDDEEDESSNNYNAGTRVNASQLREWVIQVSRPDCRRVQHSDRLSRHRNTSQRH